MQTAAKLQDDMDSDVNVKNLRNSARRVKEDVQDAADTLKDDVESFAHEAGRQVRNLVGDAEKKVVAASKSVKESIHEKPLQSSLIALGVGFVAGLLFRRV